MEKKNFKLRVSETVTNAALFKIQMRQVFQVTKMLLHIQMPFFVFLHFSLYLYLRASQVVLVIKNLPAKAGTIKDLVQSLGPKDPLEEVMATHSSILAWRTP